MYFVFPFSASIYLGMDTADLLATTLIMARDRVLPEFTYLDQRGVGLWDSGDFNIVEPAVWAMDYMEAGRQGTGGRPPPNEDGTPNETLGDQFVRLRQFLSLQESRTSGENILVIFADGTSPALLSAMVAGIPFKDVHALHMEPGEVRLDITRDSIMQLFATRKDDPVYLAKLEDGKEKLAALRKQKGDIVSLKSQRENQEQEEIDRVFEQTKTREREKAAAVKQAELEKRQAKLEAAKQMELKRKQVNSAKQQQSLDNYDDAGAAAAAVAAMSDGSDRPDAIMAALGAAVVGLGGLTVGMTGGSEERVSSKNDNDGEITPALDIDPALASASNIVVSANGTMSVTLPATSNPSPTTPVYSSTRSKQVSFSPTKKDTAKPAAVNSWSQQTSGFAVANSTAAISLAIKQSEDITDKSSQKELIELELAHDAMDRALMDDPARDAAASTRKNPVELEMEQLERQQEAMNSYLDMDDGAGDWLHVLTQIRNEPDDDDEEEPLM